MKKWSMAVVVGIGAMALSASAFAQSGSVPRTCSQAYDQCFNSCSSRYPGGNEASAKCIDKCAMARAKCDRSGCFNDDAIKMCGLLRE